METINFIKKNITLTIILISSIAVTILVGYNKLNNIENIIVNDLIFRITLAFISSFIFYIVVDYVPKHRDKKRINKYLKVLLERLLSRAKAPFNMIQQHEKKDYNKMNEKEIENACKNINPQDQSNCVTVVGYGPIKTRYLSRFEYLISQNKESIEHINKILGYLLYLDSELIFELNNLLSSNYTDHINTISGIGVSAFGNKDFSFLQNKKNNQNTLSEYKIVIDNLESKLKNL